MNIYDALKIAIKENKEIALPNTERCKNNVYYIRLMPFMLNLQLQEFNGDKRKIDCFSLSPKEIIRNDWMVITRSNS